MISKIRDFAALQSGIYSLPEPEEGKGNVYYIQARHINVDHQFVDHIKPDLKADGKIDKHFLNKGDLLVASKGKDHFAVVYNDVYKPAVASSIFIVIRLKQDIVLPAFLSWYINLPRIQKVLMESAKGTSLLGINKSDLENLDIQVPPLEKQMLILKIQDLHRQENILRRQIDLLKSKLIQQELFNASKPV